MASSVQTQNLLQTIFRSSPKIANYFNNHTQKPNEYIPLMIQLLLQSIQRRQSQQPKKQHKKHYNVAYIKHNRFLSPSQKRQVTPKVTEMIPVSPQKIVIYGKPKIKLDNGFGCPVHKQNSCLCYEDHAQQEQEQSMYSNSNTQQQIKYPAQRQKAECLNLQQEENIPLNYEEYLSPKKYNQKRQNKNKKSRNNNENNQTICSPNRKFNQKNLNKMKSPKSNQNHPTNRMTSPKSFMKQNLNHQSSCCQNYSKVESKIKDLIQRDKKNRQMEKQLERQKSQIEEIYNRQNKLLMLQKQQKQMLNQHSDGVDYQNGYQNQFYTAKIKTVARNSKHNHIAQSSSFSSQSQMSIVNLHGHKNEDSRIQCYDCQIQRLKKRKQKAKKAIKQINKQQHRRTKLVQEIINNSQIKNSKSPNSYKYSQRSQDNSILLNR